MDGQMLGKIKNINLFLVRDSRLEARFTLICDGWCVDSSMEMGALVETMKAAKVLTIDKLKDVPVQATFKSSLLTDWRVLKEVL